MSFARGYNAVRDGEHVALWFSGAIAAIVTAPSPLEGEGIAAAKNAIAATRWQYAARQFRMEADVTGFLQEGGCHCGALRYKLTAPPIRTLICHCTDCQRISGSAFGISVQCRDDAFALTGTPKKVARTLGSGAMGIRWTCPECGVWICGDAKLDSSTNLNRRIVRGGTFDDTKWIKPDAHIWTRSAQPWVSIPADIKSYPMNSTPASPLGR